MSRTLKFKTWLHVKLNMIDPRILWDEEYEKWIRYHQNKQKERFKMKVIKLNGKYVKKYDLDNMKVELTSNIKEAIVFGKPFQFSWYSSTDIAKMIGGEVVENPPGLWEVEEDTEPLPFEDDVPVPHDEPLPVPEEGKRYYISDGEQYVKNVSVNEDHENRWITVMITTTELFGLCHLFTEEEANFIYGKMGELARKEGYYIGNVPFSEGTENEGSR